MGVVAYCGHLQVGPICRLVRNCRNCWITYALSEPCTYHHLRRSSQAEGELACNGQTMVREQVTPGEGQPKPGEAADDDEWVFDYYVAEVWSMQCLGLCSA